MVQVEDVGAVLEERLRHGRHDARPIRARDEQHEREGRLHGSGVYRAARTAFERMWPTTGMGSVPRTMGATRPRSKVAPVNAQTRRSRIDGRRSVALASWLRGALAQTGVARGAPSERVGPPARIAPPVILDGLNGLIVILLFFSLWHAAVALGARRTIVFFAITTVTSWLFEEVGVVTGLVFGPYHYTATLGPLLGSVPVLIPLAWFMLIYPSYVLANLIVDGWPVAMPGSRSHLVRLAMVGALVMTAWDLIVDPILSGPTVGAWIWERGGPYYGVPIQNYLGWIATAFTVYVVYRSVERRWAMLPA